MQVTSKTITTILPFHLEWISEDTISRCFHYQDSSCQIYLLFRVSLFLVAKMLCLSSMEYFGTRIFDLSDPFCTKCNFLTDDPQIPQLIMFCANTYVFSIRAWCYSDRRSMLIRNYSCMIQYQFKQAPRHDACVN